MLRILILLFAAAALAPQSLAEEAPGTPGAHVLQAEIALSRGEYLRAAEEYRRAAEAGSDVEHARRATLVADSYGFTEEALRSVERWLELDNENDEALWYQARLHLRARDLRAARREFKALIARGDGEPDERLLALVSALAEDDVDDVYELVKYLAKPHMDSANANYALGVTALSAGEGEAAMRYAQQAIDIEPEWLKAKLLYGRGLMIAGRDDEAIDYIARIIGDDPDPDPEARMELAVLMLSVGRDDDALSQVNQILLEQPNRVDALRLMAIINFRQQRLDAAWQDFDDLLATGRYRYDALYYLGRIADFRDDTEQAVLLYSEVTQGPHAVPAQRRASALLALQLGDEEEAIRQLDDFARDNPAHAIDMLLSKAQLLATLDRHDEALAHYDDLVNFRPDEESVSLGRAELLLRMDRLDDAIAQYSDAAKRWPQSAISLNALGYTLADRTDRYREAEKLIRRAIKLDPGNPAIIDSLGWVLHKRGRHEEALVELEKAYSAFDQMSTAARSEVAAHIVEVLVALDRADEAMRRLAAAELEDPESEFLKDVRERMFAAETED